MEDENSAGSHKPDSQDFVAELTPHRSLTQLGFGMIMLVIALSCLFSGFVFYRLGAWPVLLFLVADVLIIWFAFALNFRSGKAMERIYVNRQLLRVDKFTPSGQCQSHLLNPFWTKFEISRHEEFGIQSMDLISPEKRVTIGSFLNPEDREDFSMALSNALGRVKS